MEEKVYEMYDDYYAAEAQLQELIDARDFLAESLKTAHPSKLAKGRMMLNDANKKIKECRAALKREYDAHQATEKAREEYERTMNEMQESMDASLIYLKHCHPEKYEQVKAEMLADCTPEEIEEFDSRIAHLEATRLEEFIGEKKSDDISSPNNFGS